MNELCNYCQQPLEPDENAPRTSEYEIPGRTDYVIAGYTNRAGCEHYREERPDGSADSSPWWASLSDLQMEIADMAYHA